jgi:hypothetical protein
LSFAGSVPIIEWLPSGKTSLRQQLIDELFHEAKCGSPAKPQPAPKKPQASEPDESIAEIARTLQRIGEELASDEQVAERHAQALQLLDAAANSLAHLALGSTLNR